MEGIRKDLYQYLAYDAKKIMDDPTMNFYDYQRLIDNIILIVNRYYIDKKDLIKKIDSEKDKEK